MTLREMKDFWERVYQRLLHFWYVMTEQHGQLITAEDYRSAALFLALCAVALILLYIVLSFVYNKVVDKRKRGKEKDEKE